MREVLENHGSADEKSNWTHVVWLDSDSEAVANAYADTAVGLTIPPYQRVDRKSKLNGKPGPRARAPGPRARARSTSKPGHPGRRGGREGSGRGVRNKLSQSQLDFLNLVQKHPQLAVELSAVVRIQPNDLDYITVLRLVLRLVLRRLGRRRTARA